MSATLLPEDDEDVIDMHVARILAMTPEELRADTIARGEDPDRLIAVADAALARAMADCGF
ncbi:hypothetical protein, partial [Methylobacterium sp. WL19]